MGVGKSRLSSKTVSRLQNVTYFSEEEIQEWYKVFIKKVPDRQMNLEQFITVWRELFLSNEKQQVNDENELQSYANQVFRIIDKNGDGTIDFREFLINASILSRGTLEQKLEHVFNLYDLDQNGYVTKPEMLEFIKVVNKAGDYGNNKEGEPMDPDVLAQTLANKIFTRLDRNKDGKLSLFEFISGVQSEPCLVEFFLGKRYAKDDYD